jgi:hypothetical protein
MDGMTRLKTKIGDHEFEAEGSPDYVKEQFQAWQELVKLAASAPPPLAPAQRDNTQQSSTEPERNGGSSGNVDAELSKIMRTEGRYISLTARPGSVHDAALLMLYGQKTLRTNDSVTGAELLEGMAATGGFSVTRLDRILDKLAADGDVMSFGERRGKKYRLTNTGIAKARALAKDLIANVA